MPRRILVARKQPGSRSCDSNLLSKRGPTILDDFHLREKIFHFDHERIPERVVHARGYGAHGYFENYEPLTEITSADLFQRAGEKTPAFVRFSTVAGNKGSADLARDVRGFAVKLYTQQGNWDIVGNNMPVFFIQDAIKFRILSMRPRRSQIVISPRPPTAHDNFWDFISLLPESMHMIMWAMSDRAIPRSFRFMEGFGVHTYRLVTADGKSTFVKFHWKPKLGMQSVVWNEAVKINGADPDFHRRDLWNGNWAFSSLTTNSPMNLSSMFWARRSSSQKKKYPLNVSAVSCSIAVSITSSPRRNRWRSARTTLFRGVDFSNDPLLQGRNFSSLDTQVKRLGGPISRTFLSMRPSVPSITFSRTDTCQ